MAEIEIAAGEDDANLFPFRADTTKNGWSGGDGTRRLDDKLHAFPEEKHGGDDLAFVHQRDLIDEFTEDGEGERAERGTQAVCHGVGGGRGLDFAGGERTIGVVSVAGLAADDANRRLHSPCCNRRATEEPAPTGGSDDDVEVGHIFEKLKSSSALPGDDPCIVVRVNEVGAGALLNRSGGGLARR